MPRGRRKLRAGFRHTDSANLTKGQKILILISFLRLAPSHLSQVQRPSTVQGK
jgi:hypothetical protein